jgi:AcrB/AcrD/AcrF family protein
MQAAINATAGLQPPTMPSPPIYRKTNPADVPVLMLALTSETLPLTTVGDYANSILAQKISQMPGVGLVGIGGEQNPALLAGMGLDLEAVRTAPATVTVDQPKRHIAWCGSGLRATDQRSVDDGAGVQRLHPCQPPRYLRDDAAGIRQHAHQRHHRQPQLRGRRRERAGTGARCRPRHLRAARCDLSLAG